MTTSASLLCHEGKCQCGAVGVGLLSKPLMAYRCHCSNCRGFASKFNPTVAYNQAIWCWRWTAVVTNGAEFLEYERSSGFFGLFAMHRGRCSKCKMPVIENGSFGSLAYFFSMVMAPPLEDIEPDTNIFFDSGAKKESDWKEMSTTVHSDMGSLLYEIYILLTVGLFYLPTSVFSFVRHKVSHKSKFQ